MRSLLSKLSMIAALAVGTAAQAEEAVVNLEKAEKSVAVTIGGKEFTTYLFDKGQTKPYFSPVRAADGTIITRAIGTGEDHPHHKGIWLSIDEVNEIKFWAEKGKIENASVEVTQASGNPAKLKVVNHWLGDDGKPLLVENTDISIFANRTLIYDIKFTAGEHPVKFDDTKEGLFGIRVANTLREKEGGQVTNAEGLKTTKECWGQESKWVDYYGKVDGKTFGVALFDSPLNFRKSRYHVRDYGLFTVSPFGQSAYTNGKLPADPYTIDSGKTLRLRYGLYVHDGDTQQGKVAEAYDAFVKHSN